MTIQDLIVLAGDYPLHLVALFLGIPVSAWVLGRLHERGAGGEAPWRYAYSLLVYSTCLPGIFAAVLAAYGLFILRENLLEVNLLVYLLPIVSMAGTLALMSRRVSFDDVPGFDRLSGLMVVIGITFVMVLAIERTRIWIFFGSSFATLLLLVAGIFLLLHWGARRMLRARGGDPSAGGG